MLGNRIILVLMLCLLALPRPAAASGDGNAPTAPHVIIGSGDAASCQSSAAANALDAAVSAGGTITFDCGPAPVVMNVNTNVTDKTVVIDGGGLVALSGENLRQIFIVGGSGDLTLRNTFLVDGAGFAGAAIAISSPQAKATIENTQITSNDSGSSNGGAIYNIGSLTITNSTLSSNTSLSFGGAIFNNGGTVVIRYSTLQFNQASQGGAVWLSEGSVTIENSFLWNNQVTDTGGAFHIDVGTATVTNSTFTGNKATNGGGAIYMRGNSLTLTNDTFYRNLADTAGAVWNFAGTTVFKNTIVAASRNGADTSSSLNCDGPTALSQGHNVITDNTCVTNPSSTGDLLSTDPLLDPMQALNGGQTYNFRLLPGSPAIGIAASCPPVDQRGLKRPIGPACDSGAVEFGSAIFLPVIMG